MMVKPKTCYFPGLNSLRALSAFYVLFYHMAQMSPIWGYTKTNACVRFFLTGDQGVLFFFVLSGFLITHQLLSEQHTTGKIFFTTFYKRRILRIFPLYFLLIFLSIAIYCIFRQDVPKNLEPLHPISTFLLIGFFLPNVALLVDNPILGAGHLWSVGVEDQFYLIWPLLLSKFKNNFFWKVCAIFIMIPILHSIIMLGLKIPSYHSATSLFTELFNTFPFNGLVLGGIGAWLVYNKKMIVLNVIFHLYTQILTFLALAAEIFFHHGETFIPIVFLVIILNVACNPASIIMLRNSVLDYLGKISYGIYMFHPLVIFLIFQECSKYHIPVPFIYFFTMLTTTFIAALSYRYFELPIMRLKNNTLHYATTENIPTQTINSINLNQATK